MPPDSGPDRRVGPVNQPLDVPVSRRRLIVEADGGSRGNPGPAGYGALVRSGDTGEVLAEVAEAIGVATNNVAEYRGVLAGLRAAYQIDPEAVVEARLDSKLIVEQMSGRWKIKNADLQPLALEVRRVFPPGHVTYTWVPRAENAHADRLVNQALDGKPIGVASLTSPVAPPPASPDPSVTVAGAAPAVSQPAAPEQAVPEQAVPEQAVPGPAVPEPSSPANRLAAWAPELGTPTTLLVVRHGQTELTTARRFSGGGVEGPGLDATGLEQARRAAEVLSSSGAVAVISSPMLRARQTADAIATAIGATSRVDEDWRECDFGAWEGLTLTEIGERFPEVIARWYGSTSIAPPGGESLDEVFRRTGVARDKAIARHPGQPVVVVTHSMPLRALVRQVLGAPPEAYFRLQPAPGSLTEVQVYSDGMMTINAFGQRP